MGEKDTLGEVVKQVYEENFETDPTTFAGGTLNLGAALEIAGTEVSDGAEIDLAIGDMMEKKVEETLEERGEISQEIHRQRLELLEEVAEDKGFRLVNQSEFIDITEVLAEFVSPDRFSPSFLRTYMRNMVREGSHIVYWFENESYLEIPQDYRYEWLEESLIQYTLEQFDDLINFYEEHKKYAEKAFAEKKKEVFKRFPGKCKFYDDSSTIFSCESERGVMTFGPGCLIFENQFGDEGSVTEEEILELSASAKGFIDAVLEDHLENVKDIPLEVVGRKS